MFRQTLNKIRPANIRLDIDVLKIIFSYLIFTDQKNLLLTCKFFETVIIQYTPYSEERLQVKQQIIQQAQDCLLNLCSASLQGIHSYYIKSIDVSFFNLTFGYGRTGDKRQRYYDVLLNSKNNSLFIKSVGLYCIFSLEGGKKLKNHIVNAISFQKEKFLPFINKYIDTSIVTINNSNFAIILKHLIYIGFICKKDNLNLIATKIFDFQKNDNIKKYNTYIYGSSLSAIYSTMYYEKTLKENLDKAIEFIQKEYIENNDPIYYLKK